MTGTQLGLAWSRLRARRGRSLLAALGITAVGVMVGASATVSYSLATGFDRAAARAGLPDVIASFDPAPLSSVRARAQTLPDVAALSYRLVQSGVPVRNLSTDGVFGRDSHSNAHAVVEGVLGGRRGYTIVAGHDLSGRPMEAVIERGLATAWHIRVGDELDMHGFDHPHGPDNFLVVGIAVAPDNVAFPLASGPRVYVPYADARRLWFHRRSEPINQVLLWSRSPAQLPLVLEQARLATYGISGFRFVTRAGVRVLIDGAAGIVIALLIALSVVALASAAVMLSAAAYADTRRRLQSFGTLRAVGATRPQIVAGVAAEALIVAVPAATMGVVAGWALAVGPTTALLDALNEFGAGWDLAAVLAAAVLAVSGTVALTAAWPTWQAAGRAPATLLAAADVAATPRGRRLPSGPVGLGMRMAASRPLRTLATVAVLATSTAVILLMLSMAALLSRLQHDPGTVGKRYALTVPAGPAAVSAISAIPGVARAAPRYVAYAVDSYDLGESFQLVAYPGDPSLFEDPPLIAGRRVHGSTQADVGQGLAAALNLRVGSTLAAELPSGKEARFRVVGVVAALANDGLLAFVLPPRLLAADPNVAASVAVDLTPGADLAAVKADVAQLGLAATATGGVTAHSAGFLAVLAALLQTVAGIDGAVCVYAVVQMLSLTALERRRAVATLRACGADRVQLAAVFFGAALLVAVVALPLAVGLERWALGPRTAALATSYATVSLSAGDGTIAIVSAALVVAAATASAYVTRIALQASTTAGLRGD